MTLRQPESNRRAPSGGRPARSRRSVAAPDDWRTRLLAGDLRTIGEADAIACELAATPSRSGELVTLLFDLDRGVRMRAADALEKASAAAPELLCDHEQRLLACAEEAEDAELKWHLARMLPRLDLQPRDRAVALPLVHAWLSDRSVIVRVEALQALAGLAVDDPALADDLLRRLRETLAGGRPAEKARARRILRERGVIADRDQ